MRALTPTLALVCGLAAQLWCADHAYA